jgi:diguanylate cyclase (GGDEF)-like protein
LDEAGRLLETEWLLTKVDERKLASDRISTLAATDEITGLANRAAFKDRLRHALADAGRGAPSFSILYLDLDRFQDVKSTHGHSSEDVLLKSVAARVICCARATDLVAHVGGARFAVLQSNLTDLADAAALASRIRDVLSTPHLLGDAEMCITVSIGISTNMFQTGGRKTCLSITRARRESRTSP